MNDHSSSILSLLTHPHILQLMQHHRHPHILILCVLTCLPIFFVHVFFFWFFSLSDSLTVFNKVCTFFHRFIHLDFTQNILGFTFLFFVFVFLTFSHSFFRCCPSSHCSKTCSNSTFLLSSPSLQSPPNGLWFQWKPINETAFGIITYIGQGNSW